MTEKPKLGMYWASSCGGCEISVVNLHERLLDLFAAFELVFCPCLMDAKYSDVEAMEDGEIDLMLFNGAIGTSENIEMAHLLRRKSKIFVAYGSCAMEGCVPGLANLHRHKQFIHSIYLDNPSLDNPDGIVPQSRTEVPEGALMLPEFYGRVSPVSSVTTVDYYIPGCPPELHNVWNVLDSVIKGAELPRRGSVLGGGRSNVCNECERLKENKKIRRLFRVHEMIPNSFACLMEQGLICMGLATRDGCGALCPKVNMPCIGCYGPPEGVEDQGARMIAALGSVLDLGNVQDATAEELIERVNAIVDTIPDYAGTYYKFSLPASLMKGRVG